MKLLRPKVEAEKECWNIFIHDDYVFISPDPLYESFATFCKDVSCSRVLFIGHTDFYPIEVGGHIPEWLGFDDRLDTYISFGKDRIDIALDFLTMRFTKQHFNRFYKTLEMLPYDHTDRLYAPLLPVQSVPTLIAQIDGNTTDFWRREDIDITHLACREKQ